jgi:hypothetical protein
VKLSAVVGAVFFDYGSVAARERAGELGFLAGRPGADWAKVLDHTEIRRSDSQAAVPARANASGRFPPVRRH